MTHRVDEATTADDQALVELWNACVGSSHPMTLRALRQVCDGAARTSATASLVIRDAGLPVGWALVRAFREPLSDAMLAPLLNTGGLGALCVAPAMRKRGLATALLAAGEQRLREWGLVRAITAVAPFHFLPGVPDEAPELDRFLERRAWAAGPACVDLHADVSEFEPPSDVLARLKREAPAVELRPLAPGEAPHLHAFLAAEFAGVWQYLLHDFLAAGGSHADVMVAVENGELLAFAQVHDERSLRLAGSTLWHPLLGPAHGGLGPIGVAAAHRKRGLGFALLCASLAHQRRRGVRRMVIDWTTLEQFYGRAGFRVWRRYRHRHRELATPR